MCEIIDVERKAKPRPTLKALEGRTQEGALPPLFDGGRGASPGKFYNVESKCSYFHQFKVEKILHTCVVSIHILWKLL